MFQLYHGDDMVHLSDVPVHDTLGWILDCKPDETIDSNSQL